MTILVTGGGGFIGSHLVDLLLEQGHSVRVLDNFSTGRRSNLLESNINLDIYTGDICILEDVDKSVKGVDAIVHLAAVASVQASVDDPIGTHEVNLVGTVNLLESAKQYGVKKFVFASSAAVYGNTEQIPVSETSTLSPLTPYAVDKLSSEYYIDYYRRQFNLNPVIFRFFNIFGPRQDPSSPYSGVISIFMQRAIDSQPISVFGDGCQSRDFVYVNDLVCLLANAVVTADSFPVAMNVGNGKQTNLNDLLEMITRFRGQGLNVTYAEPRAGDIKHSCADNSLVEEKMGYESNHPVAMGLKKTYDWYLSKV